MKQLFEATMGAEQKKLITAKLKPVLDKFGIKGKLSVRGKNVSFAISEGKPDFIGNAANIMATNLYQQPNHFSDIKKFVKNKTAQVNHYHITEQFSGSARTALLAILKVLNTDNYTKSDWTNDWVEYGHYVNITIGDSFGKPYVCTGTLEKPNDKLKTILGDELIKESKLVQDKTNLIAQVKQILKPSNTFIKAEGGKDDSLVITITKSDIDFVGNYTKVSKQKPEVIRVSSSLPGLKIQFDGEAHAILHKLLNAVSVNGQLTLDNSTSPFISFKIIPKTFKFTGKGSQDLLEDAKQLIQNPILKVFDQFGKQYLAQVLDASLNKMIQVAAKRGAKVTVQQLIAEIQQNPKGTTAQALFKAMATVIKQVSAQIPTIVTTNVSSINEAISVYNEPSLSNKLTQLEPTIKKIGFTISKPKLVGTTLEIPIVKGKFDLDTVLRNYFASKNSLTKHQKLAGSTVGSYMLAGKSKAAFDKMKSTIEAALLGQKLLGGKELTSIAFLFGANEFSSYELKGGQPEELSDEAKQIVN